MSAKILSASPVVEQIKKNLIARCQVLRRKGITPSMCVVLIGNDPASLSYIKNKKKMREEIGANFTLLHLADDIEEKDFIRQVETLNNDDSIHGIIVQLPVPERLKTLQLPNLIVQKKDIDGFHGLNTQNLYAGSTDLTLLLPCTPKGVVNLLNYYKIPIEGRNVIMVGRSLIVGKPLAMLLSNLNATVTLTHSQTSNLRDLTKRADIVISAIGKPHFFNRSYFSPEKSTIVIDVGMNKLDGKLVGDVDQSDVMDSVAAITPVPGGVGPMTVISLMENLISSTENQNKDQND